MLGDLNELLEKHRRGEDTEQDFADFMDKHGDFFPENPQDIDELMDALAQRAAAAQRMRNSMTQEQRDELDALAAQAFGSPELMQSLAPARRQPARAAARRGLGRLGGVRRASRGSGSATAPACCRTWPTSTTCPSSSRSPTAAPGWTTSTSTSSSGSSATQAAVDAKTLAELERALNETGYLKRGSDGQLKLSPKAMRQLGKALLKDVANRMSGRQGQRDMRHAGAAGELSGASREWAFGDTEPWNVTRTITNAVVRTVGEGGDPRDGVRLDVRDIEVNETEARTQAAVALLVDTSFSMAMANRWVPMKRTALALHQLITSRFRGDHLQLIGFGRSARVMEIEELTALDAMWDKGTNLHHALLLANRHFRKHPNAQPVLLIVTDGEPTSHLEPDGEVWFSYPPHPLTVAWSIRELDNAARLGAQTTFFRLGDDPGLARFITRWPTGWTAGWSHPSSTTSAPPSSAATSAGAAAVRTPATCPTGTAAAGSGSAAERHDSVETGSSGSLPPDPANGVRWPRARRVLGLRGGRRVEGTARPEAEESAMTEKPPRPKVLPGGQVPGQPDPRVAAQAAVDPRVSMVIAVLAGRSVDDVAQEWDVESTLLHRWVRDFLVAGSAVITNRPDPDEARQRDRFLAAFAHECAHRSPSPPAGRWCSRKATCPRTR